MTSRSISRRPVAATLLLGVALAACTGDDSDLAAVPVPTITSNATASGAATPDPVTRTDLEAQQPLLVPLASVVEPWPALGGESPILKNEVEPPKPQAEIYDDMECDGETESIHEEEYGVCRVVDGPGGRMRLVIRGYVFEGVGLQFSDEGLWYQSRTSDTHKGLDGSVEPGVEDATLTLRETGFLAAPNVLILERLFDGSGTFRDFDVITWPTDTNRPVVHHLPAVGNSPTLSAAAGWLVWDRRESLDDDPECCPSMHRVSLFKPYDEMMRTWLLPVDQYPPEVVALTAYRRWVDGESLDGWVADGADLTGPPSADGLQFLSDQCTATAAVFECEFQSEDSIMTFEVSEGGPHGHLVTGQQFG